MIVPPPYPSIPIADDNGLMHRSWFRWLKAVYTSLGWNKSNPMYGDLPLRDVDDSTTITTHNGFLRLRGHPDASNTASRFTTNLPHNWFVGADLIPYIDWLPTDGNGGNVVWSFGHAMNAIGEVLADETSENVTAAAPTTDRELVRTKFTALSRADGEAFAKGNAGPLKFTRLGTDGDDSYATSVLVVKYGIRTKFAGVGGEKEFY